MIVRSYTYVADIGVSHCPSGIFKINKIQNAAEGRQCLFSRFSQALIPENP
jgi:hypothetical protein